MALVLAVRKKEIMPINVLRSACSANPSNIVFFFNLCKRVAVNTMI